MKKVKLTTATLALLAGTVIAPVYSTTAQAAEAAATSETAKEAATTDSTKAKDETPAKTDESKTVETPKTNDAKKEEAPKTATKETPKADKTEAEKALEAAKADALAEIAARVEAGILDGWESIGLEDEVKAATTIDAVYAALGKKTPEKPVKPVEKTELEKAKEKALADIKMQLDMKYISQEEANNLDLAVSNAKSVNEVNKIMNNKKPVDPVKPAEKTELEKAKEKALADVKAQLGMNYISEEEANNLDLAISSAKTVAEINELMGYKPTEPTTPTKPEVNKELEAAKNLAFAELQKLVDEDMVSYLDGLEMMGKINDAKSIDELKALGFLAEEATKPVTDAALENAKDLAFAELKGWFEDNLVDHTEAWELTGKINDAKSIEELRALGFLGNLEANETEGSITVKYVDQDGKEIKESSRVSGKIGAAKTVEAAVISGYTLEGPSSLDVEFKDGAQTFTFTYKVEKDVLLEVAKDIAFLELKEWVNEGIVTYEEGLELMAQINDAKSVAELKALGFKAEIEPEVNKSVLTIKYVDQNGKEIKTATVEERKIGSASETFEAPAIEGYDVMGNDKVEVEFSGPVMSVVFQYREKEAEEKSGKVKINYVDEKGNELKASDSFEHEIGKDLTIKAPVIEGYDVTGTDEMKVVFVDGTQEFTFVYRESVAKEENSTVTVKYLDEAGNELKASETKEAKIGEKETFEAATITGYEVVGHDSMEITYADSPQTITFTYKALEEAKETHSTLTVKHVDEAGKEIGEAQSFTREIGSSFVITAAQIPGYEVVGNGLADITFADGPQTYTFKYKKVDTKVQQSTVTVKYVDKDGKELIESNKLTANEGDIYEFYAAKIEGYKLVGPDTIKLAFTDSPQTVTFTYEKIDGKKVIDPKKVDKKDPKKVENKKADKKAALPQTGEAASAGLLAGGLMSMLTAAFVFFRKNK